MPQLHQCLICIIGWSDKQGCILFPRFLYPSLFSLQVKSCVFCNLGGVNNYGTFLLQICFIMFQKFPKIPHKNPMFFQICHIFLISFPVLSKVVLVLADVYRPKRNYIHPWFQPSNSAGRRKIKKVQRYIGTLRMLR